MEEHLHFVVRSGVVGIVLEHMGRTGIRTPVYEHLPSQLLRSYLGQGGQPTGSEVGSRAEVELHMSLEPRQQRCGVLQDHRRLCRPWGSDGRSWQRDQLWAAFDSAKRPSQSPTLSCPYGPHARCWGQNAYCSCSSLSSCGDDVKTQETLSCWHLD